MFGVHRCKKLVRKFVNSVRFINMLRIAYKHPQSYWNLYLLPIEGLDHGQWILSLGSLLVQMAIMLFSLVFIV